MKRNVSAANPVVESAGQKDNKIMGARQDHCRIRVFSRLDGREVRLYCRLIKDRRSVLADYSLYEDFQGRQWLEIAVGERVWLEELVGESFEQRVAADLLVLGLNKYSG
jgi:hypothetical protein